MSWDKNTVIGSELEGTRETLDELAIPYKLSTIGTFRGCGLNDGEGVTYELRRLQYAGRVMLEYAELDADCDVDDVILSQRFDLGNEPKDWQAIRRTDIFADHSYPHEWETFTGENENCRSMLD